MQREEGTTPKTRRKMTAQERQDRIEKSRQHGKEIIRNQQDKMIEANLVNLVDARIRVLLFREQQGAGAVSYATLYQVPGTYNNLLNVDGAKLQQVKTQALIDVAKGIVEIARSQGIAPEVLFGS